MRIARLLPPLLVLLASCIAPDARTRSTADAGPPPQPPSGVTFLIENGFGAEADWVPAYMEATASVLVRLFDQPDVAPPRLVELELEQDPDADYLGGWASPAAMGFVSDQWPREPQRQWILAHELVNLFAAHYAGAGGFPSDWWSNGRSPFPMYVAGLALRELGYGAEADWLRSTTADERDHELYWALHERFGFAPFAGALAMLRRDAVDLGEIEPPWPHGSATRSEYMLGYLSLAAGENLTELVAAHGVGTRPSDWGALHPGTVFHEYALDAPRVAAIMDARERLFTGEASEEARALFRAGHWEQALVATGAAR